jgi:hypothetical protein
VNADQALSTVKRLYDKLTSRRSEIEKFESYHRGEHPLAYASEEWKADHARRYRGFSDNWCGIVGGASAERTKLTGIRLGDDDQVQDPAEKALWRDWMVNELPTKSSQGFLTASIARRSAAIVWGDDEDSPVVTWEHPSHVIVDYEPGTGLPRYALKSWCDGDYEFATLYTPDFLWKFRRLTTTQVVNGQTSSGLVVIGSVQLDTGGWSSYQPASDDTWPLDNPLGELNVLEFRHKPPLKGEPLSRISGTVAMQDFINLMWAYLAVAADYASMPARVILGSEAPKMPILNAQGVKIGEKPVDMDKLAAGRLLYLTGAKPEIDSWDAASLDPFTNVINVAVKHIASQTKTPIHYIVGDLGNVNGETLKATEIPLANDVREDHEFYGSPARRLFRLMALARGENKVADACRTAVLQWHNPETASEAQTSDAALKDRQVGFPLEWVAQERYGLSQSQVARLMTMIANDPAGAGLLNRVPAIDVGGGADHSADPLGGG